MSRRKRTITMLMSFFMVFNIFFGNVQALATTIESESIISNEEAIYSEESQKNEEETLIDDSYSNEGDFAEENLEGEISEEVSFEEEYPVIEYVTEENVENYYSIEAYSNDFNRAATIDLPIVSQTSVTVAEAQQWAKKRNATQTFIDLAPLFEKYAKQRGGINWLVAYVQAAKETGYGRFGGVLDESFHNTCGLKNPQGGGDYDPNAHKRFDNWDQGVIAHLDHLALYAGASGYPKPNYIDKWQGSNIPSDSTYDPRHTGWYNTLYGKCPNVSDLGGNWAPSTNYGNELVDLYYSVATIPRGRIDSPDEGYVAKSDSLNLTGWAGSSSGVSNIQFSIDGKNVGQATLGLSRPDIANAYPEYANAKNSGFSASLNLSSVDNGNKTIIANVSNNDGTKFTLERTIKIDRNQLNPLGRLDEPTDNFEVNGDTLKVRGWAVNGSGVREVKVYVDGKLKATTQTNLDRPDIAGAYPQYPNAGKSGFQVDVNISDITNGTKAVKAEVIGNDGTIYNLTRNIKVNRAVVVDSKGRIDEPGDNLEVKGDTLRVRGWAIAKSGVKEVKVYVDGKLKSTTNTNLDRPDIAGAYPQYPNAGKSGFQVDVNISDIANGTKTVKAEVIGNDGTIYNLTKNIKVNRAVAVDSKGRIDEPGDNLEVKGDTLRVRGWAVAKSGVKEVKVYVDGKLKATTKTNLDRPDIAGAYPQYPNASKSGFQVDINISDIVNGSKKVVAEIVGNDNSIYTIDKTIKVNRPAVVDSKGRIDEPGDNLEVKGDTLRVRGWAVAKSGVKEVKVYVDGKLKATAKTNLDRPDIAGAYPQYPNASKSGFQVDINISDIVNGSKKVVAEVVANDNSIYTMERNIKVNRTVLNPVGRIDEPSDNYEVKGTTLYVRGWAATETGVKEIKVYVDGKYVQSAKLGLSRPDIANAYPKYPNAGKSGFETTLDISNLSIGKKSLLVEVISNDNSKYNLTKSFIIPQVDTNTLGRLDEPAANITYGRNELKIRGWAVNHDGVKEVKAYVNGVYKGLIPYGKSRPDVNGAYPGYPSGNNAGYEGTINIGDMPVGKLEIRIDVISKQDRVKSFITNINYTASGNKVIVVDAGHNEGGDRGAAVTLDGRTVTEQDLNIQVAVKLKKELEKRGFTVIMTREEGELQYEDLRPSLERRVRIANEANADFFVSIHHNSGPSSASGTEVYYSDATPGTRGMLLSDGTEFSLERNIMTRAETPKVTVSKAVAKSMVDGVSSALSMTNRGVRNDDFYVVKNTLMPSVLYEVGFMTNESELRKVMNSNNQQKIAEVLANAIEKQFK